jgi:uncharacterized membrane protein
MHLKNPVEWLFAQFEATATVGSAHPAEYWNGIPAGSDPVVMKIGTADVREAIRRGLHDFAAARTDVIFLCLIYPVVGLFLAGVSAHGALLPLLFPVASGFALLGPFFAIGLYEMSRRRELTGKINWLDVFGVVRSPSIGPICGLGLLLIALFGFWLTAAQQIYDFTLGPLPPASVSGFAQALLTTPAGWVMIGVGTAVGAVFALGVLAISIVSFPLLLDRHVTFGAAVRTSFLALRRDPKAIAFWGLIVSAGLVLGSLPCFLGLVVVLPVLGHATWHLYRALVKH